MAKAKPSLKGLIRRTDMDARTEPEIRPVTKSAGKLAQPAPEPAVAAVAAASPGDDLPATGHTQPVGVGLRSSELSALDAIVEETGVSRNALLRYATRDFIKRYRRGEIDLAAKIVEPPPRRKRLTID